MARSLGDRWGARLILYLVLGIALALIGLSLVVDAPAAQAAPDLFAGLVFCGLPYVLYRQYGLGDPGMIAAGVLLGLGGLGVFYEGLSTLNLVEPVGGVILASDLAILGGLVVFLVRRFRGSDGQRS